ncbi:Nn.00g026780.m01.CDS01 [Neocucurbitaria sp. VM-36]
MPNLLDLPPELFQQVTHDLVNEIGINAAWRLRTVCSSFAVGTEHDVFTRQPENAFGGHNRHVLKNGITRFILMRLPVPRDANKDIFNKINSLVKSRVIHSGSNSYGDGQSNTEDIVNGVKLMWLGGPEQLARDIFRTSWEVPEPNIYDELSTAVLYKSYDNIATLLLELPANAGRDEPATFLECKPLQMAAETNDKKMLDIVLAFLKSLNLKENRRKYVDLVWTNPRVWRRPLFPLSDAIEKMIAKKNADITKVLLDFYQENLRKPDRSTYDNWAAIAMFYGNEQILTQVLDFQPGGNYMVTARHTLADACQHSNGDTIRAVFSRLRRGINNGTILNMPIFIAVRSGSDNAVEVMVELGADVHIKVESNIPAISKRMVSPIDVAIYRKDLHVIEYLLTEDAVVPHVSEWPKHKTTYDYLREQEMARLEIIYDEFPHIPTYDQQRFMTPDALKAVEYKLDTVED